MQTVCRACGYQRKPTDDAPEWVCPACGKAYAKTEHESPSALVIYADGEGPGDHGSPNTYIVFISLVGSLLATVLILFVHESSGYQWSLTAMELVMPWIALVLAYAYRKSLSPELGEYSSVILCSTLCILMVGVGILAAEHSLVFDTRKVWPRGILFGIPFGLACAAVVRGFGQHVAQRAPVLVWSLLIGVACVYGGALVALGNRWFDHSHSTIYSASVIGKFVGHTRAGRYYTLQLAPWGPVPNDNNLVVDPSEYNAMEPGRSMVCMATHSGALDMPWGAQVSCTGQTPLKG